MLSFSQNPYATVLSVTVAGKLSHGEFQRLVARAQKVINQCGRVRLVLEFKDCNNSNERSAMSMRALGDALRFALTRGDCVDRCAIIGDRWWHRCMATLCNPFFTARYFDRSARRYGYMKPEDAWRWIEEHTVAGVTGG